MTSHVSTHSPSTITVSKSGKTSLLETPQKVLPTSSSASVPKYVEKRARVPLRRVHILSNARSDQPNHRRKRDWLEVIWGFVRQAVAR